MKLPSKQTGFTIVELLIVIVVIGILAAITVVAYNGIQTRANNLRTEDAAAKFRKALILYATEHGAYPTGHSFGSCLGEAENYPDGCYNGYVSATFNDAIRPYMGGTLPNPSNECLPMYTGCRVGAAYSRQDIKLDGKGVHTWSISYVLKGDVKCTANGQSGGSWVDALSTPNASGRIEYHSGTALCRLILPNPAML